MCLSDASENIFESAGSLLYNRRTLAFRDLICGVARKTSKAVVCLYWVGLRVIVYDELVSRLPANKLWLQRTSS